ncbi:MAG: nucleotide exchange factor GrpE [Candidatus Saccharimonas sp.]
MAKKRDKKDEVIAELTADVQRVRADFENYRKRTEQERLQAAERGEARAIVTLLPAVDTIERATAQVPEQLASDPWVQGVMGLTKQLHTALKKLEVEKIDAHPGTSFDPSLHQAIQFDESATGDHEVIAEELQTGYRYKGMTIRESMVKVTRQ